MVGGGNTLPGHGGRHGGPQLPAEGSLPTQAQGHPLQGGGGGGGGNQGGGEGGGGHRGEK